MMDFATQPPLESGINVHVSHGTESVCIPGAAPRYLQKAQYLKAMLDFEPPIEGEIYLTVPDATYIWPAVHLIYYLHNGKLHDDVRQNKTALMITADLAQYFGVPDLLDDALHCLYQLLLLGPCWSSCLYAVLADVPDQLPQSSAYLQLRNLAVQQMQRRLGSDLEVILASSSKVKKLVSLPFELLAALLSSHETQAAHESSVVCAITYWLASQAEGTVTHEQKQQLISCVRLRGLPKRYCQQVLPLLDWCADVAGPAFPGHASIWLDAVQTAQQEYANICRSPSSRRSSSSSSALADKEEVRFVRHALERCLGEASLDRREQQRWLLLLREPRAQSAVQGLQLAGSILPGHISGMLRAGSIRWQSSMCQTYAGIHWQLVWRVHPVRDHKCKHFAMIWALQVGVMYRIPGVDPGHPVVLELPTPVLHHPAACPAPYLPLGVTTRQQLKDQGGQGQQLVAPLPMGNVRRCEKILLLLSCTADQANAARFDQCLQPFLDETGMLPLRVTGMEIIV